MKFEEALALMREGKIAVDPAGQEWKLKDGKIISQTYLSEYIGNPKRQGNFYFSDECILGEWTIKEEPKYQYLVRHKGSTDWNSVTTGKFSSEEEALESFKYPEEIEIRRVEP